MYDEFIMGDDLGVVALKNILNFYTENEKSVPRYETHSLITYCFFLNCLLTLFSRVSTRVKNVTGNDTMSYKIIRVTVYTGFKTAQACYMCSTIIYNCYFI